MITSRTLDKKFILIITSSVLSFFLPILSLKISARGRAVVGSVVPDIVVYGSDITGKDKGFWSIEFGVLFQLCCNTIFLLSMLINYWAYRYNRIFMLPQMLSLLLACAFPIWLLIYESGVLNNSDNIAMHIIPMPHIGMLAYALIVYNTVSVMDKIADDVERKKKVV